MTANTHFSSLICPIDSLPLVRNDKQFSCMQGHSFDLSKQGYINLLPVQHKKSKAPGDSQAMILARSRFLDSGVYQKVVNQLINSIEQLSLPEQATILDAGCGEGYYTQKLSQHFSNKHFIGVDISKNAIKAACKKTAAIDWIVASNANIPVQDQSVDLIICIFGFHSFSGFSKVLKPNGKIILVDPERNHLLELRQQIYSQVKQREAYSIDDALIHQLKLIAQQGLQFTTRDISHHEVQDLLMMTPHLFRANKNIESLTAPLPITKLTVDMLFRILHKSAP